VQLAQRVVREATFDPDDVQTVAGLDVSFKGDVARAAVVVLSLPNLLPVDCSVAEMAATFPYIPGYLAFREGPAVLAALEGLSVPPDLLIFDAHGLAHPQRVGLACHLGVVLDRPSIGCAKSRLIGHAAEPDDSVGAWVPLCDGDEVVGAVVRSRSGVRPLHVSIGHRIDLETAIDMVLRCTKGYRLPETTRYAHRVAGGEGLQIERAKL
jgi:deoxyribonuclease V